MRMVPRWLLLMLLMLLMLLLTEDLVLPMVNIPRPMADGALRRLSRASSARGGCGSTWRGAVVTVLMLRRGTGYFAATGTDDVDKGWTAPAAAKEPSSGHHPIDGSVDDDERQRREPMPIAACHLNKVRRMWGCCTGVQACSR